MKSNYSVSHRGIDRCGLFARFWLSFEMARTPGETDEDVGEMLRKELGARG